MTYHLDTFAAASSTLLAGIAGSKVGTVIADTAQGSMPIWMEWALGPFGALVGVLMALVWIVKRLNAAETREEERRKEREIDRKLTQETLISLVRETNSVTTSAVEVMRAVNKAVEGCHGRDKS